MLRTSASLIAFTALLLSTGCTFMGDDELAGGQVGDLGTSTDTTDPLRPTGTKAQLLRKMQSCDELTDAIQDELRASLAKQLKGISGGSGTSTGGIGVPGTSTSPIDWGTTTMTSTSTMTAAPGTTGGNAGAPPVSGGEATGTGTSSGGAGDYTTTNTQVAGIDESDIVKTDGKRIYVLRNSELLIANAYPANKLALEKKLTLDGGAVEMFAVPQEGGGARLVIYSTVSVPLDEKNVGDPTMASAMPCGVGYCGATGNATKLTVVDVAVDGTPKQLADVTYEGSYVSARRDGDKVRTILQMQRFYQTLNYYPEYQDTLRASLLASQALEDAGVDITTAPAETLDAAYQKALAAVMEEKNRPVLDAIRAEDYLPSYTVHVAAKGGQVAREAVACSDFYVPRAGTAEAGVTLVAEFDMAKLDALPSTGMLGTANTVYANQDAMTLATNTWDQNTGEPATILHAFRIAPDSAPSYDGSAEVVGSLYGQFALNEKDGFYEVATSTWNGGSQLVVLKRGADGLEVAGKVDGIAPGEQIRSVRYLGDRAYVVTFRQTDPLFVIDLTDPTKPTMKGSVEIPGFSSYLHPLGPDHLLTIGRAGDAWGAGSQVRVQIFDVADALQPKLTHYYDIPVEGVSLAESDHRAFTFHEGTGTLMVPFQSWGWDQSAERMNWLEVMHVNAKDGISRMGQVGGSTTVDYCGNGVSRGLLMDEVVYAVSNTGIEAAALEDLNTVVGKVTFDAGNQCLYNYYY